jgi:thymidylate synthase
MMVQAIKLCKTDPNNRRIVMSAWYVLCNNLRRRAV